MRGVPGWQSHEPDAQHHQPAALCPAATQEAEPGPRRGRRSGVVSSPSWDWPPRGEEEVPVPGEGLDQLPPILSHLEDWQGSPTLASLPRLALPGAPA